MDAQIPLELVAAAQSGDARDIERLLRAVWPDAYRLARAIVPERGAAEDVAQEACISVYRGIASLRRADAFRTWLYRIVVREALKHKKIRSLPADVFVSHPYWDDPTASIDLWRALRALPDNLRAIVVLRYFENLNSREIGEILQLPHATVRVRLMTALRRLRPLLGQHDVAPAFGEKEHYAL